MGTTQRDPFFPAGSRLPAYLPVAIRTRFDGTKSQLKSWRITVEDRLSSDCAHLTPRQKWIFVYDGLTDQIQKRLSYYFESEETREWNAVAFLNHLEVLYSDSTPVKVERLELRRLRQASDEPFSDFFGTVRGADGKGSQVRRAGG
ncbi:hypothetical protein E4U16_004859 [Claviceps sp. LM84 group G4]|nr:hypothetical protein E4U16_004859 [Claviceps sp. LM84 group G4]